MAQHRITLFALLLLFAVAMPMAAQAQVPSTMSYQGVLTDADGTVLPDGSYTLTFRLYEAASGGSALWEESHAATVTGGLFQVVLGSTAALDLVFDRPYWLSTQVDTEAEMDPRFPLTAVPYSLSVRNPLHLYDVPEVAPGDLTPPDEDEDQPARVLVWSQADGVVRWLPFDPASEGMGDSDWVEDVVNNEVRTSRDIVLNNGTVPFRVRGAAPAGSITVEVVTANSVGVDATSDNSDGVRGTSVTADGVFGTSTNAIGVRGTSTNDAGVRGVSTAANGVEGSAMAGIGVVGTSADSTGVAGASTTGDGVTGTANGAGTGVSGSSQSGPGVQGASTDGPGGRFLGDVELRDNASGTSKLFLETVEAAQTDPATTVLVRDPDGFVRQAALPPAAGGDADWVDTGTSVHTENKTIQLQDGGGAFPFTVSNGANPATRLTATNSNDVITATSTGNGVGVNATSTNGIAVIGISAQDNGIEGYANGAQGNGVQGFSASRYGVRGISNASTGTGSTAGAGVYGSSVLAPGVFGLSTNQQGVVGQSTDGIGVDGISESNTAVQGVSEEQIGVFGRTNTSSATVPAVRGDGGTNGIGVDGIANVAEGVKGFSKETSGVFGRTEGMVSGTGTGQFGGVTGSGLQAFGVYGSSQTRAGVHGFSTENHGVHGIAADQNTSIDFGGVYGQAMAASGVYGNSENGPGVRGRSASSNAGQFEGEVHIINGPKPARLFIEEMVEDKTAPCLVWADDMYVKQRKCWTLEDEEGDDGETTTYQVSEFGIRIKGTIDNEETVVFEVNTDGTSTHKGLETFEAGIKVPLTNGNMAQILPDDGIAIRNGNGDYFFHANPSGNGLFSGGVGVNSLSVTTGIVSNTLQVNGAKNFRIDHPLDPLNKVLIHTSIESSERLNLYSGNTVTDAEGFAVVQVPDWFEALNTDIRYQLTVIGTFAQAIVKEKLLDGRFVVQTDIPHVEVSWQLTGVRHDAWARANPTEVEAEKEDDERGRYLNPQAYGMPARSTTIPPSQLDR